MKFEINPNELTTDQRAHVAAFITWLICVKRKDEVLGYAQGLEFYIPSEEQRLDAEQASDLREISGIEEARDIGAAAGVNLNAIFGTPNDAIPQVPLDAQGLPWDSRIHASTKTFIADGSWKLRRGVDPAEVESVKAQLKELMAVPVEVTQPVHNTGHVDLDPSSRIPIPPKSHYLIDLIARMSSAIVAGKMTQATVAEMCAKHGVSEFMLLSNRPDLLPLIDADMKAMGV